MSDGDRFIMPEVDGGGAGSIDRIVRRGRDGGLMDVLSGTTLALAAGKAVRVWT